MATVCTTVRTPRSEVRLKRVFHLIPSLEIGGIETMMTRFIDRCPPDISYTLVIFEGADRSGIALTDAMRQRIIPITGTGNARRAINLVRFLKNNRDDVIVSSTWKMAAVVFIARLFGWTGLHWSFTHRSSSAGPIDYIMRRWQVRHSGLCLVDSAAAGEWVRRQGVKVRIEELPPIFAAPSARTRAALKSPVRFCFIGRLAPVKNLPTVFTVIEALGSAGLALEFDIYGPDGGLLEMVEQWVKRPALPTLRCRYLGAVPPSRTWEVVQDYHFLISCSHTEGFALSVAEAMQVGVVPIVGNVGGPATYCNASNAVVIREYSQGGIDRAVRTICEVAAAPLRYERMSAAAQATFAADAGFVGRYSAILRHALEQDACLAAS